MDPPGAGLQRPSLTLPGPAGTETQEPHQRPFG